MKKKIILLRKGIFPLGKLEININNKKLSLWGKKRKEINIDKGIIDISIKMFFWRKRDIIEITPNVKSIEFRHYFSDMFYYLTIIGVITILIMTFKYNLNSLYLSLYVLTYMIMLYGKLFSKKKDFFMIITKYDKE